MIFLNQSWRCFFFCTCQILIGGYILSNSLNKSSEFASMRFWAKRLEANETGDYKEIVHMFPIYE